MAEKQITRRLKIFVNGQEVDATITNLRKNLAKFRSLANRQIEGTDKFKEYNAEVARLETELGQARKAQRAFREDTKLTEQGIDKSGKALAEFTGSFNQMLQGYRSGDILQVKEGFNGVKSGIQGATKAALAFIATPIGAAITALVGIGAAAKAWFDYNSNVVEALRTTQQITGLTGEAADQARIRAEAISEAFDGDFEETLRSGKALAAQFGISFQEAFDIIENQLVRGQNKNEEFFDSLKEYPTFFKQAGFSAEEFGNIIATGYDLSIFSDKLPDALKEADLALKEQTTATRDALVNAFGASFTDDILSRVSNGEITTKKALQEIAAESERTGLTQQQQAQLTADVFKGAGEDAGGAIKIFEAVDKALNKNQEELTESEQLLQDQITANTELKGILSDVFSTGDEGFGLLIDKAKLFGTEILIDILRVGVDVYNWFVDLNNQSGVFSAILKGLGLAATRPFEIIGILISNAKDAFGSLGDVIEGVFTLDFNKIQEGMAKANAVAFSTLDELKEKAISDFNEIKAAFDGKNKLERKNLTDFVTEDTTDTEEEEEDEEGLGKDGLKAVEKAEKVAAEQLKIEENKAAEMLRINGGSEKAIEELKKKYADKKAKIDANFSTATKALRASEVEWAQKTEQQKLNAVTGALGSAADAFNEGSNAWKAIKIAETTITTYQSAVNSYNALAGIPIVGPALGAVAAGIAVATGLAQIAKIKSTNLQKVPKPKSFARGGETGFGDMGLGSNSGGHIRGVVEEGEYVIPKFVRQDPEVPAIVDYLEMKRVGQRKSYQDGGEVTNAARTENKPTMETEVLSSLFQAVTTLNEELQDGLKIMYTLNDEIKRRELAQKLDDTINESKGN